MIAETKKQGIQLVLVRVKRRRDVVASAEPEYLREYIADLRHYLSEQGVPLLDFTSCSRIQREHYADGDHLNARGRDEFTRRLAVELLKIPELPQAVVVRRNADTPM